MSDREGNLIRVAEMVADRAGADLARHMEMVRQLEVKIAALRVAGATGTDFNFCQAGGDRRWKEWRMQELHRLNRALAALKAREPALREVSGRATIRREVLLKMTGPSHQSPSRAG